MSSVKNLKERAEVFTGHVGGSGIGALEKAKSRLNKVVKDIEDLQDGFGAEMGANLTNCKERNMVIQKQSLRTFIKFERLLHLESKAAASGLAGNHKSSAVIDT